MLAGPQDAFKSVLPKAPPPLGKLTQSKSSSPSSKLPARKKGRAKATTIKHKRDEEGGVAAALKAAAEEEESGRAEAAEEEESGQAEAAGRTGLPAGKPFMQRYREDLEQVLHTPFARMVDTFHVTHNTRLRVRYQTSCPYLRVHHTLRR